MLTSRRVFPQGEDNVFVVLDVVCGYPSDVKTAMKVRMQELHKDSRSAFSIRYWLQGKYMQD